jgi:hypothetical protein
MNSSFLFRLWLDLLAAGLLLVAFAYWWQGNLVHELVGTGMFALLVLHNVFNRHWYRAVPRAGRKPINLLNAVLTLVLLAGMLALLATSLLISQSVFDFLPVSGGSTVRQLHILAAWWILVLVAVHIGLRWPIVMTATKRTLGIDGTKTTRTLALRVAAVALAVQGIASSLELGMGTKLTGEVTMDMWDFNESTAGFFFHLAAVAGLVAVLTYYAAALIRRLPR